jgi:hypothetical protein
MPALVKSNVGSFPGTSEADGTMVCPLLTKKSIYDLRISEPVRVFAIFDSTISKE